MGKKARKQADDRPEAPPAPAATASPGVAPVVEPVVAPAAPPVAAMAESAVPLAADVSAAASANAPFIYFENAGVSGHMNGIIRVTLEAARIMPGENNKVYVDRVIVGHLRMNLQAAQSLRNALDRALLIAAKPASPVSN